MVHVNLTQKLLRHAFDERISVAGLRGDRQETPRQRGNGADFQSNEGTAAIAVLREFLPSSFAESCLQFSRSLHESAGQIWLRNFTRTIFLSGNPGALAGRFGFDWLAVDGSIGWIAPRPPDATLPLRRLLCLFKVSDTLPDISDYDVAAPGSEPADARTVYIATAGVSPADYLVHLNHILAEGVLSRELPRDCAVSVRHVPKLTGHEATFGTLRVHFAKGGDRLRAYAGIARSGTAGLVAELAF